MKRLVVHYEALIVIKISQNATLNVMNEVPLKTFCSLEINSHTHKKSLSTYSKILIDSMRKLISYEKQIQNSSRAHSIILSHSIKMFSSHTYLIGVEILAAAE